MVFHRRQVYGILIATLALFVWSAVSHMFVINGVGYSILTQESARRAGMSDIDAGLYAFPAPPAWSGDISSEALDHWQTEYTAGPSGMLIIRPDGEAAFSGQKLLAAFLAQLIGVTLVSIIAAGMAGSFWSRLVRLAAIGPIAICAVSVIYWNWYAFPLAFFLAQVLDVTIGWTLVAAIIAGLQPARPSTSTHAT